MSAGMAASVMIDHAIVIRNSAVSTSEWSEMFVDEMINATMFINAPSSIVELSSFEKP